MAQFCILHDAENVDGNVLPRVAFGIHLLAQHGLQLDEFRVLRIEDLLAVSALLDGIRDRFVHQPALAVRGRPVVVSEALFQHSGTHFD